MVALGHGVWNIIGLFADVADQLVNKLQNVRRRRVKRYPNGNQNYGLL